MITMNADHRLAALYEEWRLTTESEGDAIRSLAWERVAHCQRFKAELREKLVEILDGAGMGVESAEQVRRKFQPVLEHLIGLELRNNEWLATERLKLEGEQGDLNRSQRVMRQLQGTYGSSLAAAY